MCIIHDGKRGTIIDFQHVKPGKGGAFVRTKLKELKSGRVVEYTFRAGEKFEYVRIETKKMQFLYNDGDTFYFMDNTSYEQVELDKDFVGDSAKWLKENDEVEIMTADGEYMGVEPPMFVELEVTETDPGFKGDPECVGGLLLVLPRRGAKMPNGEIRPLTARPRHLLELADVAVRMVSQEVLPLDHNEPESTIQQ
jgi:elongation factor P